MVLDSAVVVASFMHPSYYSACDLYDDVCGNGIELHLRASVRPPRQTDDDEDMAGSDSKTDSRIVKVDVIAQNM